MFKAAGLDRPRKEYTVTATAPTRNNTVGLSCTGEQLSFAGGIFLSSKLQQTLLFQFGAMPIHMLYIRPR